MAPWQPAGLAWQPVQPSPAIEVHLEALSKDTEIGRSATPSSQTGLSQGPQAGPGPVLLGSVRSVDLGVAGPRSGVLGQTLPYGLFLEALRGQGTCP